MSTEKFITKIREIIASGDSFTLSDTFTPDLPQEGENICSVTILGGNQVTSLSCGMLYAKPMFRVLIRGTENDKVTRRLADEVYEILNLLTDVEFDNGKIINIIATSLPTYAFRDENNRIYYNITFNSNVVFY